MFQNIIVLCALLALSSALSYNQQQWHLSEVKTQDQASPRAPKWSWNMDNENDDGSKMQQSVHDQTRAYGNDWSWNKLYDVDESKMPGIQKQKSEVAVINSANLGCESAYGELTQETYKEEIIRSIHICTQENPEPEKEDLVGKLTYNINYPRLEGIHSTWYQPRSASI